MPYWDAGSYDVCISAISIIFVDVSLISGEGRHINVIFKNSIFVLGGNCNVPPRRRTDCGYPGISRQTCLKKKCCFDNIPQGGQIEVPRTIRSGNSTATPEKMSRKQCQVQPKARVNCGYPYISAQECYKRGCCFDSSIVGVIWCFFPQEIEGIDSVIDATG
uniref:P-type domain-containing protein n=1 Tax=Naja naja TaxID=35670 RepID=A0A8C6XXE6_NAJNA